MAARAPAKLNLYLDVLARRPDGYHEIESVMQTIDLCDRVVVERREAPGVALTTSGRPCPGGAENLATRAAERFLAATGATYGVDLRLHKAIPLGAGLGGGSSDAATVLAALDLLAGHPLAGAELAALAAELGSDVPFFLTGGLAIVRGRGERVEPLELTDPPRFRFVVLFPRVNVSTAGVYAKLNLNLTRPKNDLTTFVQRLGRTRQHGAPEFHNSLSVPFRELHPELGRLCDRASVATGLTFSVSGSGSALFAVADREDEVEVLRGLQSVATDEIFFCGGTPGSSGLG